MFYGWNIVGVTFVTHFVSVGFVFYSYGVFFKALTAEFGGSRLGVGLGLAVMNVAVGILSPFLGRALDRGSVRTIMCLGALLMSAGFVMLSRIDALWQFYAILGTLLAGGTAALGGLAGSTLVARWFAVRRGTALGVSAMGISLSGLAMAPAATQLISSMGWRNAYLVYAIATSLVVVPLVWLLVVDRPEKLGLRPDGAPRRNDPATLAPSHPVVPVGPGGSVLDATGGGTGALAAARNPNFWVISMVIALNFAANGAVLTHIIPHGTDIGYDPLDAALVLSTIAGLGVVGKVLFGWVADRVEKRIAMWLAIGLQAAGVALILRASGYAPLITAGAIFGLGMGGIVPLWGALIGAAFGREVFGRVMGLMSPVMIPVMSSGIPFAGWVFDRTGSYGLAFRVFIWVYAAAALTLVALRLPAVEPGNETHDLAGDSETPLRRTG